MDGRSGSNTKLHNYDKLFIEYCYNLYDIHVKANKVKYSSAVYYSSKMSKLKKEKLRYRKYDEEAFRIALESIRYILNTDLCTLNCH